MKTIRILILFSLSCLCLNDAALSQTKLPECQGTDVKVWTNCFGSQKYDDGTYIGEFQNGVPNGKGEISMVNGNKYKGDFKNGCFDGVGIFNYANGDTYEGQFVKCKKEGPGKGRLANGQTFDFVFKNDKQVSSTPSQPARPKNAPPENPNAALNIANWKASDGSNLLDMSIVLNEKNSAQRISKDLDGNILIGNGNDVVRVDVINFPLNYFNAANKPKLTSTFAIFENQINSDFLNTSAKQDDQRKKFPFLMALMEKEIIKALKEKI